MANCARTIGAEYERDPKILELLVTKETLGTKQNAVSIMANGKGARLKRYLRDEKFINYSDLRTLFSASVVPLISLAHSVVNYAVFRDGLADGISPDKKTTENLDFL